MLFDHQIVDTINRILQTVILQRCDLTDVGLHHTHETYTIYKPQVLELKQSAVELLQVMCEETDPETEKLVQNVFKNIDIDALQSTLVYFYKLSQDPMMVRDQLLVEHINTVVHYRNDWKKMMMQKELLLELTKY